MKRCVQWSLILLGVVVFVASTHADNWPRFRGPNGTGTTSDKEVPIQWTANENMLWKVAIPGVGHSSPIVWDKTIFLQTAKADASERTLLCLNADDGKVLWSRSVPGARARIHPQKGTFANSTPATDGERVYIAFWDGKNQLLHAYDFKGELLWTQDLGPFASQHGAGVSPIVHGGQVIFANDQDGKAAILCFDAKTGKKTWEIPRKAFRACYAIPLILESANGRTDVIVASTAGIAAYDFQSGNESWHWTFHGTPKVRAVGSPITCQGSILIHLGNGEGDRHTVCLKPGGKGELTDGNIAWESTKPDIAYVPCSLAFGDHIYSVTDKGFAICTVASTGEELWNQRLGGNITASPVLIDGKVYAVNEAGAVYVFPAAPTFKLLAKNNLGEGVLASPAVSDGRLYIRGTDHLFCIGKNRK